MRLVSWSETFFLENNRKTSFPFLHLPSFLCFTRKRKLILVSRKVLRFRLEGLVSEAYLEEKVCAILETEQFSCVCLECFAVAPMGALNETAMDHRKIAISFDGNHASKLFNVLLKYFAHLV